MVHPRGCQFRSPKYHGPKDQVLVLSKFDSTTLKKLSMFLKHPRGANPYQELQDKLCQTYKPPLEQKLDVLLAMTDIGDKRLVEFGLELQRLAADVSIDDVLKRVFLKCLPQSIITVITSSLGGKFEAVMMAADRAWMAVAAAPTPSASVMAVYGQPDGADHRTGRQTQRTPTQQPGPRQANDNHDDLQLPPGGQRTATAKGILQSVDVSSRITILSLRPGAPGRLQHGHEIPPHPRRQVVPHLHRPKTVDQRLFKARDPVSNRQHQQLAIISKFGTEMAHIPGLKNVVADALTRQDDDGNVLAIVHSIVHALADVDLDQIARDQGPISEETSSSLRLEDIRLPGFEHTVLCDTLLGRPRILVPETRRCQVFDTMHNLAHPSGKASLMIISRSYAWKSMRRNVLQWARQCHACATSKVTRHTRLAVLPIPVAAKRFVHVHVDVVGPFPADQGCKFLLTMMDRTTCWPKAVPLANTTADTILQAFMGSWVACF